MKKLLSFLLSLVCLYFAFQQANISDIATTITKANFIYILYALIITGFTFVVRSIRWRILLEKTNSNLHSFSATVHIGYFLNNILPLRGGDLVRAKLLSNYHKNTRMSYVFGSLVGEKIIDLWMIGLFTITLIGLGYTDVLGTQFTMILIGTYLLSSLIIFGKHTISAQLLKYIPVLENFIDGYQLVSKNKLHLFGWSIILWLAPAAIGTYHLAVVYCLNSLYGVRIEDAQVAAVVMHSIFFVYTIIFGYVYLLTESIDIKSITNDKEN